MPTNKHLEWIELQNFAPGLFTGNDWLAPPSSAQTLTDATPTDSGGIRAFYKATSVSTTGIADITKERPLGLAIRGGIPLRSGAAGDGNDRYLCTYMYDSSAGGGSKARPKLYRMDGTNSETTWTQIYATSGTTQFAAATDDNNSPAKASFKFYKLSSGAPNNQRMLLVLRYVGTDAGLWRLNYNDLSAVQHAIEIDSGTPRNGPIDIFQSRIVIGAGNSERLWYSDIGVETFSAANYIDIDANQILPNLSLIAANEPSDLLIGKEGAPWTLLQGDITDPTVRSMATGHHTQYQIQDAARTPQGVAFVEPDAGVVLTDGRSFNGLSGNIDSESFPGNTNNDIVCAGDTVYMNDYLFCPNALTYDFRTDSWFTVSELVGAFKAYDQYARTIMATKGNGVSFSIRDLIPYDITDRVSTYTWKSASLRAKDGRQIEIREVQVYLKSYVNNSSCDVTVGGVTRSITGIAAGRQMVQFLFAARDEVLDVTVAPNSNSGSYEAPSIEAIRIGAGRGHQIT